MTFNIDEMPVENTLEVEIPPGKELRCPHFNHRLGRKCNKKFCDGEASLKPQRFKCPNCKEFTIFKLVA